MRRVRTSTWVLLAIFLGTLALYLWVKPPTPSAAGDSPATAPQTSAPADAAPLADPGGDAVPAADGHAAADGDAAADEPAQHRAADPRAHPVSVHVCDSLTA